MKLFLAAVVAASLGSVAYADSSIVLVRGMAPTMGGGTEHKQIGLKYEKPAPGDAKAAAALLANIGKAAEMVCTLRKSGVLAERIAKCTEKSVALAVKDIDSPDLTAAATH
jgi:hypothetical protein